jgi:hypothetical protein
MFDIRMMSGLAEVALSRRVHAADRSEKLAIQVIFNLPRFGWNQVFDPVSVFLLQQSRQ